MSNQQLERITHNPKYRRLVRSRTLIGGILSAITLAIYLGFIGLIAYNPKFLGTPIDGEVTTIGIPIGILVIVSAFLLTGVYVFIANTTYDRLIREIKADAQ
jgi:uncharacterized membrane protein (DUF485 family)